MAVNILSVDCYLKELETGEKQKNCERTIPYASNIIWELSSVKSDPNDDSKVDYLIRMLYNGKLMLDCNKYLTNSVKITYEGYCTFEQFEEVSKKLFIIGDAAKYDEICKGKPKFYGNEKGMENLKALVKNLNWFIN